MMRLRVSRRALCDLDGIFDYWAGHASLEVADRLMEAIEEQFALLCEMPQIGRKSDEFGHGVRSFPAGKYLIYYRKTRAFLEILHVFHGARDQARAFSDE